MESLPGYPYTKEKPSGAKGKKFLFDQLHKDGDRTNYRAKPIVVERLQHRIDTMLRKNLPDSVWVHCTKDERRPMAKVRAIKTRLFTMAPVDLTLLTRMMTMDFVAAYIAAHAEFYSAIGIDVYSPKWTKLYNKLAKKGRRGGDGDYGTYDGGLDPDSMYESMDIINDFYMTHAPEGTFLDFPNRRIFLNPAARKYFLRMLGVEFVHTLQLVLDILHRKGQGNPSGNALTAILNSIVGEIYLMVIYLVLCDDFKQYDYFSLDKYTLLISDIIFGDDNEYTISDQIIDWFNPKNIGQALAKFGIEYTTADKSGSEQSTKNLDDLRFLKCGFRHHDVFPDRILATMDPDTIYELTNWTRICPDQFQQCRDQCHEALKLAYHHGPRFYNDLRIRINNAINEAKVPMERFADEYDLLDDVFLSKFY